MVGRPTQLGSIGGKTADIKYAKQNTIFFVYQATPIFLINGITLQPAPPPAYRATSCQHGRNLTHPLCDAFVSRSVSW